MSTTIQGSPATVTVPSLMVRDNNGADTGDRFSLDTILTVLGVDATGALLQVSGPNIDGKPTIGFVKKDFVQLVEALVVQPPVVQPPVVQPPVVQPAGGPGSGGNIGSPVMNDAGYRLLRKWEGCILCSYDDANDHCVSPGDTVHGTLTIGYGHTGSDVFPGMHWTAEQAEEALHHDIEAVARQIRPLITCSLNDNQFSAFVCFAFNIGVPGFRGSSALHLANAGDLRNVPAAIGLWNKAHVNGIAVPSSGLTHRRNAEIELWNTAGSPVVSADFPISAEQSSRQEQSQGAPALRQFSGPPIPLATIGHDRPDLAHDIQQILSDLGYLDPPPDGFMGPTSIWALTEFCRLNGLSTDGGFTPEIARTLLNPNQPLPDIRPSGAWIDRVIGYMVNKGYFICRHPDCKNIIYVEGVDPDGKLNAQTPNTFEDLRVVFSIQPNGVPVMQSWVGTTEPGRYYTIDHPNPEGAARIKPGQYKSWHVGIHTGESGGNAHEALVQSEDIDIYRDKNRDFRREGPIFTGKFGIDQHKGFNLPKDDAGEASAGCLVGRLNDGHLEFMALIKTDPRYINNNGYNFMTAVIPGAEALSPL